MQKIMPCLWFDTQAEQAVNFYTSLFNHSKILDVTRYDETSAQVAQMPAGTVMTITFQIEGQDYMALNGGPAFKFTEAVSFIVNCESQAEVDRLWNALIANGGEESQCGWLKDKYGLSWQIVPTALDRLMTSGTPAQAQRVMAAMFQMKKLDLAKLEQAYNQA